MWYFSWVLGLGLACAFAVLNAMWFELATDAAGGDGADGPEDGAPRQPGRGRGGDQPDG